MKRPDWKGKVGPFFKSALPVMARVSFRGGTRFLSSDERVFVFFFDLLEDQID